MSTVSELVVSLGLNTTTFHSKIKEVNQTMKLVKSEFENASAGVKNFQSTQDGLKTKISSLNSQIDVTKTKISLYKTEIENTKKKLEEKYSKKPSLIIAKIPHLDDKEFHAKLVHKLQFTDITSV